MRSLVVVVVVVGLALLLAAVFAPLFNGGAW